MIQADFIAYLDELEVSTPVRARALAVFGFYASVLGDRIRDAFLSEYVLEDAGRQFESVWLFSDDMVMEGALSTEDHADFLPHKRAVRYCVLKRHDYDFEYATEASRMTIEIWFDDNRFGELKASSGNCRKLKEIALDHIMPNIAAASH
jgi:hypothetical protein